MSEANKEASEMSLEVSKREFSNGNKKLALHFAEKAMRLYPSDQAKSWLSFVQTRPNDEEPASVPNRTKYSEQENKEKTKSGEGIRKPNEARSEKYSNDQLAQVKKQLAIDRNDYYAVLGVSKDADDIDIKKAYRQLALQFHPDKNNVPGADEAFKSVSRAFSCLSDPEKRKQYNAFGSGSDGNSRSGFAQQFNRGFSGGSPEVSPEELFNMFFGGVNPSMSFSFGGGVPMFFQSFNGHGEQMFQGNQFSRNIRHQRRRREESEKAVPSWMGLAVQLLPLILVVILLAISHLGNILFGLD